jgi:hypothetical protein
MTMKRAAILMSCFLWIGCDGDTEPVGGTSLEGPYPCGSIECTTGQVCRTNGGGGTDYTDSGVPSPQVCITAPDECVIADCQDTSCAPCIRALCDPHTDVSVSGRDVACYFP